MLRAIAGFIFVVASCSSLHAQDSTSIYVINKIILQGNKVTKSYIVLRELPFKEGDAVTGGELDYARERIYSTGLFTKVLIQTEPVTKNLIDLLIYVEERWYIWPYPVLGFRDRDLRKFYAGAGIVDLNFRGMDEALAATLALGYDPFGAVTYGSPSIGVHKEYIFSMGASYSRGRNVLIQSEYSSGEFDDTFGAMYVDFGKRFGIYSTLSLGAWYNYVARNPFDSTSLVLSPNGKDIFASLKLEYSYDSRDLKSFASEGSYLYLSLEKYGLGERAVNFGRFSFDGRMYFCTFDFMTLAARFHGSLAEGPEIPQYEHTFFGYYERIRGMFNTTSEGESILGGNMELRIPIIKKMYIEFPNFPLKQFISNRVALYWNFFADVGETMGKYLDIMANRSLYGYGGGLSVLLPYDAVFQLDCARGSDKHLEFVLDLGETI